MSGRAPTTGLNAWYSFLTSLPRAPADQAHFAQSARAALRGPIANAVDPLIDASLLSAQEPPPEGHDHDDRQTRNQTDGQADDLGWREAFAGRRYSDRRGGRLSRNRGCDRKRLDLTGNSDDRYEWCR